MILTSKSGKQYIIIFQHIDGDFYVRNIESHQERWIKHNDTFYKETEENEYCAGTIKKAD